MRVRARRFAPPPAGSDPIIHVGYDAHLVRIAPKGSSVTVAVTLLPLPVTTSMIVPAASWGVSSWATPIQRSRRGLQVALRSQPIGRDQR